MSTNRGYKIYDIRNYLEITENNPYKDYLGNLNIAIPYYRSNIIFLTGSPNNTNFKGSDLVIWNDEKNSVIAKISLKKTEEILDVFITWNIFFVSLKNKILIFDIKELKLCQIIEDIYNSTLVSASNLYNPSVIAHVSNLNPSYIKIEKFITEELTHGMEISRNQMNLITGFNLIDAIKISDFGDYICVVEKGAQRIHLYSLFDYELKFCLWRGSSLSHTIHINFDLKCKFMSVLTESKTLHIFKLYENQKKTLSNKINRKICENANTHRFSKFQDNQFGNYKQSLMKKIKVQIYLKFFIKKKYRAYIIRIYDHLSFFDNIIKIKKISIEIFFNCPDINNHIFNERNF